MDPLSQGVVGVTATQTAANKKNIFVASFLGLFSGMAPDLDVLIKSSTDPLLALEYHRHFTHALVFIPVGGLLCALVFYYLLQRFNWFKAHLSFKQTYFYCTVGYATHALLDACTTYGTQLFWPFSDVRIAWNNIAVIDPLFTLPVLTFVVLAILKKRRLWSIIGLVYGLSYLLMGVVQHDRALEQAKQLAETRGHAPESIDVKPTLANIVLWKSIYLYKDRYYVDGVHVLFSSKIYEGESIERLDVSKQLPWLESDSQQARDLERFRWFSDGYLAISTLDSSQVIDIRYSATPNKIIGLWGIELSQDKSKDSHVEYVTIEKDPDIMKSELSALWRMIWAK